MKAMPKDTFDIEPLVTWDYRHVSVSSETLSELASDERTTVSDKSQSHAYGGMVGDEQLLSAIKRVALSTLTPRQAQAALLWIDRVPGGEIAAALGIGHQRVSQLLHGDLRRRRQPGVFERLRVALKVDEVFMNRVKQLEAEVAATALPTYPLGWYAGIASRPAEFVPLATLMMCNWLADKKRQLTYDDLVVHVPRVVAEHSLYRLRINGYVMFDGHTITIRKTPLDQEGDI